MAADPFTLTAHAREAIFEDMNLATDTFNMILIGSTTNVTTSTTYAGLTGELSTANGYTSGGQACTVTCTYSGSTVTIDCSDETWTASGGSIVARYAALRNVTTGDMLGYILLDNSPADVTTTDGNDLTIQPNASGIKTFTF